MKKINYLLAIVASFFTLISCGQNQKVREISPSTITQTSPLSFVDLGLPSGVKWAVCNVGASSPEEAGTYFAWGEVNPKSSYTEENSITDGKSVSWLKDNNYLDQSGNLNMSHDAANKSWGGNWRMPTAKEIQELIDNTIVEWARLNGTKGMLVTSSINGNSIFLPVTGYYEDSSLKAIVR